MLIDVHKETERGDIITTQEPLMVEWKNSFVYVPVGFECDGASVPEFLWGTVSPRIDPRTLRGAIAHDYIYRHHPPGWTKRKADSLFYHLIRKDGLGWWRSQKAYWGVFFFGKSAWNANLIKD